MKGLLINTTYRCITSLYFSFVMQISTTPINSITIQISCLSYILLNNYPPVWLSFLKVLLSNDIEKHPGVVTNVFFSFCNWNVNSLAQDNFHRVQLLEAHNSIFKYDLISLCETSLNDLVKLPDSLLDNYTFVSRNSPNNTRHGGVGLFYKNSLPLVVRDDLGFDETIVVELKFGRKKIPLHCYTEVLRRRIILRNLKTFYRISTLPIPR